MEELKRWVESYGSDAFLAEAPDKSLPPQPSLWFALWLSRVGDGADVAPGTLFEDEKALKSAFGVWWEGKRRIYAEAGLLHADGKMTYMHRKRRADGEWLVYEYKQPAFVKEVMQLLLVNQETYRRRQYRATLREPVRLVCSYFNVPAGGGQDAADYLMRLLCKRQLVGPFLELRAAARGLQTWTQHRKFQVSAAADVDADAVRRYMWRCAA